MSPQTRRAEPMPAAELRARAAADPAARVEARTDAGELVTADAAALGAALVNVLTSEAPDASDLTDHLHALLVAVGVRDAALVVWRPSRHTSGWPGYATTTLRIELTR